MADLNEPRTDYIVERMINMETRGHFVALTASNFFSNGTPTLLLKDGVSIFIL
ncbi:MAG TPA: hypothetical protein VNE61_17610 [Ktedonobacteraceae bacterium]|nr:hypothetical protein [Ktedonobacteraceae bacterium]